MEVADERGSANGVTMRGGLTIFQKGLILVTAPLLIELVLLGAFAWLRGEQHERWTAAERSEEVLVRAQILFNDLTEMQSAVRGSVIAADPNFATPAILDPDEVRRELETVRGLTPSETAGRFDAVAAAAEPFLRFNFEMHDLVVAGRASEASTRIAAGEGERFRRDLRRTVRTFIEDQRTLGQTRQADYESSVERATWLLIAGAVVLIAAAVASIYLFSRLVTLRLAQLQENTLRLAEGRELSSPIRGRDEVALLDRAFRGMAESLNEAHSRQRDYAVSLEQRTVALEAANRELQNFASVASHDLQEPLRKIQAFGDRLRDRFGEQLGEQGSDYLERMRGAATRMRTLIEDLLSFSRLQTKAKPFEPVDLAAIAGEVVSDLEGRIHQSGGRVEIGRLPTLEADPTQMRQLLQNLIGNGLKFRRPEEPPVVRVEAERASGNGDGPLPGATTWTIMVRDNGIGFDEKYLDRIFDVFQRLHGRGEYEGTGMGLAICRRIVTRHGGRITARSAPGQGTTFLVQLPARPPKQPDPQPELDATRDL